MVASRSLQFVGVRAVVQDIRTYLNDANRMATATAKMTAAVERADAITVKSAIASRASEIALTRTANAANKLGIAQGVLKKAQEDVADSVSAALRNNATAAILKEKTATDALGKSKSELAKLTAQLPLARATTRAEAAKVATGVPGASLAAAANAEVLLKNNIVDLNKTIGIQDKAAVLAARERIRAAREFLKSADPLKVADQKAAAQVVRDLQADLNSKKATSNKLSKEAASLARQELAAQKQIRDIEIQQQQLRREKQAAIFRATALVTAAVIVGVSTAAIVSAAKYETELTKINALTFTTKEQTAQLGQTFLELSSQMPVSAADLAAGAYFALSNGIKDVDEATQIAIASAKAQTAQMGNSADISKLLTSVLNAYKGTNITTANVADILTNSIREGGAEAKDYANQLGRVIPIAAQLGVNFDEVTAAIASLTNIGLDVPRAMTGVLGLLDQINRVAPQSEEAFAGIGLSIADVKKRIQEVGLVEFMIELAEKLKNNQAGLADIFPERRSIVAFFAAFGSGAERTRAILESNRNATGSLDEAYQKFAQTTAASAQILKNNLTRTLIEMGSAVLPQVNKSLQDLNKFFAANREEIKRFTSESLKAFIDVLTDVAKGIGVVNSALATIVGQRGAVEAAIIGIGLAFAWALPGGPVLAGLGLILIAIGKIKDLNDFDPLARKKELEARLSQNERIGRGGDLNKILGGDPTVIGTEIGQAISKGISDLGVFGSGLSPKKRAEFEKELAGINETIRKEEELEAAREKARIELSKLTQTEQLNNTAIKLAKEELQKLTDEFKQTSEAAGQVESILGKSNLFAEIPRKLQEALGLSNQQVGAVQAANAVQAATDRANNSQRNYEITLSMVAQLAANAASGNAQYANSLRQVVSALARATLEAQQAAASTLFSRPTREVANLNLDLARNRQQNLGPTQSNDAQIRALQDKFEALNKQSERAQTSARNTQQRQQAQVQKQQQAANDAQQKASEGVIDQLRIANLIARQTYERLDEQFGRLLDANTQQQSTLQETFRKQNDEFSRQILEATGKGDITAALDLSKQQREASNAYVVNAANLVKVNDQLQIQQKEAARVEAERQRQVELAEALAAATEKQISVTESQTGAVENQTGAVEGQTEAVDKATSAIDAQKEKIQSQIDKLTKQNETMDRSTQSIQDQIAVYEAETAVMKALVDASDQTLLTQAEQGRAAQELAARIFEASGVIRRSATSLLDLLPGDVGKIANETWKTFIDSMGVINNKTLVEFRDGLTASTVNRQILDGQYKAAIETQTELVKQQADAVAEAEAIIARSQNQVGNAAANVVSNFRMAKDGAFALGDSSFRASRKVFDFGVSLDTSSKSLAGYVARLLEKINLTPKPANQAHGGFFDTPTNVMIGETYQKELILPLERPARARQLLAQIPPSLMATLRPQGGSQTIFAPNITVTGETLDAMEAMAMRAVHRSFQQARATSSRQGGQLTNGLGPAALRS